ncbi:type II toxin-antitoxin system RelE/ParE family toxin [Dehalobacter sp. TeCB1]|uniref:type II toxin-antitoxin system RelE/ParE family toxin n=1 Tax=Dehalobacter sp. TeCB1 TaxID=1843715 RepID=UPI00083B14DB|nr:type II toxin-antitoxin system RelE/ParE family toxin [Dehalobacter sp. TeCB1]OCZ54344.1 hypothetical protein A7D23_05525 [Dehalobacter sp. TeCB1]
MNVFRYQTAGGKDLIAEYLDNLPAIESAEGWKILEKLEEEGFDYLKDILETRPIDTKAGIYEIKFKRHNRFFYLMIDRDNIYILHVCKKQKNKAELTDIRLAKQRAIEI